MNRLKGAFEFFAAMAVFALAYFVRGAKAVSAFALAEFRFIAIVGAVVVSVLVGAGQVGAAIERSALALKPADPLPWVACAPSAPPAKSKSVIKKRARA